MEEKTMVADTLDGINSELKKYAEETNETPIVEKSEEVEATEAEAPVEAEN